MPGALSLSEWSQTTLRVIIVANNETGSNQPKRPSGFSSHVSSTSYLMLLVAHQLTTTVCSSHLVTAVVIGTIQRR